MIACQRLFALAGISTLLATAPARTEQIPFERSLAETTAISLEVGHADLKIRVDPDAPATLRVRYFGERKPASVVDLDVQQHGHKLSLRRPPSTVEPESAELIQTIAIELILGARHELTVKGDTVTINLEAPRPRREDIAATATIPEPGDIPRAHWHFVLRDSQAHLVGIEHALIEAEGGLVQFEDTAGSLLLTVAEATVEGDRHRGYLRIDAEESEVILQGIDGALQFSQRRGRLEAFEVGETIVGEVDGGSVTIQGWRGNATVRGNNARIVFERGAEEAKLELTGRLLDASVGDHAGTLLADLDGGTLRARTIFGPVEATARNQAEVEIAHVDENVNLALEEGANGHIIDVTDWVSIRVNDGRVEVDGVERFSGRGENAEAIVRAVQYLEIVSFKNSRIDLDLTEIQHHPALAFKAATEAHIRMPMPCSVRLASSPFAAKNKVRVSGCVLYTRGNMPPRDKRLRTPDERSLVVNVVDEGSLDVEGVVLE